MDQLSPEDRETYLTTLRKVLDERLLEVRPWKFGSDAEQLEVFSDHCTAVLYLSCTLGGHQGKKGAV